MIKKWWNKKTKEQQKWFLIKAMSTLIFLLFGLSFGLITLKANGWSLMDFIKNPTVDLVCLILLCLIIFCLSVKTERRS